MILLLFVGWYVIAVNQSFEVCRLHDQRDQCRPLTTPSVIVNFSDASK